MRNFISTLSVAIAIVCSTAFAGSVGVVDMRQIFQNSKQAKDIQTSLTKQFSGQKEKLEKMQQSLQDDMNKLQKNQTVMDKNSLDALKSTIEKERDVFSKESAKYQEAVFAAQNKEMAKFMSALQSVAKDVAAKEKLDVILPKNGVLYSSDTLDVTNKILKKLQ